MNLIKKRGKRAAVTLFIILGLLILIASLLFFFLRNSAVRSNAKNLYQMSAATTEVQPIKALVENCMSSISKAGLRRLGMRGGYIYPDKHGFYSDPLYAYMGNAVQRFPNSDMEVPYWFYMWGNKCSDGKCRFGIGLPLLYSSNMPGDDSIETQLSDYIKDNILACIGGVDHLKDFGLNLVSVGDMDAKTTVTPDTVNFALDWPLKFQVPGSENEHVLENFFVSVPLRLQDIYKQALTITGSEIRDHPLERLTITSLIAYTGFGDGRIPPFSKTYFSLKGSEIWIKRIVKDQVKSIIAGNIPLLQYYNSRNYVERAYPDLVNNYIYNVSMYVPSAAGAYKYDVNFDYNKDYWDTYVGLNCAGELCMGQSIRMFNMIPTGFQDYKFYYNISYPVLVTIYDPHGMNDEGYTFQFFLESNIIFNKPAAVNMSVPFIIQHGNSTGTLFCDDRFRTSGLINITAYSTKEKQYGSELSDVDLKFGCGEEMCNLGTTDDKGKFQGNFPVCMDGLIYPSKEGYIASATPISTFLDTPDKADIFLYPKEKIKVDVMKILLSVVSHTSTEEVWDLVSSAPSPLSRYQYAIVRFERIKTGPSEQDHMSYGVVNGSSREPVEFEVAPGTYQISVDLFDDQLFVIPPETRTYHVRHGGDITVDIPEIQFNNSMPIGMLRMNFTFIPYHFKNFNLMTLYVISPDFRNQPRQHKKVEMLEVMNDYEDFSTRYKQYLTPKFSRIVI